MFLDFLLAADSPGPVAPGLLLAICSRRLVEGVMLVFLIQMAWYSLPAVDAVARMSGGGLFIPAVVLEMSDCGRYTGGRRWASPVHGMAMW